MAPFYKLVFTQRIALTLLLSGMVGNAIAQQTPPDSLIGNGLTFDGSSNYVDTRVSTYFPYYTVMAWVMSPQAPQFQQGKGPVHYEKNFQFNWDHVSAGAQGAVVMQDSAAHWHGASFGPLEGNRWYHLAATYDGDTLRAYKNGRLISKDGGTQGPAQRETGGTLKIGRHATLDNPQYHFFTGSVDEVRVYRTVLSQEQIASQIFHAADPDPSDSLALYYQLNESSGDSTLDNVSGHSRAKLISNPVRSASQVPFGVGYTLLAYTAPFWQPIPPMQLHGGAAPQGRLISFSVINTPLPDALLPVGVPADSVHPPYYIINALDTTNLDSLGLLGLPANPTSLYFGRLGYMAPLSPLPALTQSPVTPGVVTPSTGFGVVAIGPYRPLTATRKLASASKATLTQAERGTAILTLPAGQPSTATLYTADGRLVQTLPNLTGKQPHVLSLPLTAGLYLLRVDGAYGSQAFKVVR